MTRALPDAPATHFRLSPESWAEIAEAYRNGASARQLAAKWRVSPSTIYRYACRDGFTKKRASDAVARAHARALDAEDEAERARIAAMTEEEHADEVFSWPEFADLAPQWYAAQAEAKARAAAAAAPVREVPEAEPEALRQRTLEDMARALARGQVGVAGQLARLLVTLEKVGGAQGAAEPEADAAGKALSVAEAAEIATQIRTNPYYKLPGESQAQYDERKRQGMDDFVSSLTPYVIKVATGMLGDHRTGPGVFSRVALRWRAETFGPEVARNDYEEMVKGGWDKDVYDEAGNILPGYSRYSRVSPGLTEED